jgi:SAM-dependent MidA family methyltransferase
MTVRERVVALISRQGPIPFERFMEAALYGEGGFFTGPTLRSEKSGDFLTSPEVSSLFGETLAVFVERVREEIGEPFTVVEVGAGSGSLLRPLLDASNVEAIAVEASPAARGALARLVPVSADLPDRIRGVVLANELLDNLPMALAQRIEGSWRERWVGLDRADLVFVDREARPEVREWLERFAGDVPESGWVEIQLEAARWLADLIGRIEAGALVVFDYGDTAENLVNRRLDGTLRTYRSHHLGPHPLDDPGATDITADVNFTPLIAVAEEAGCEVELWRQDDFLAELGLRDRLSELRRKELEAARSGDETLRLQIRAMRTEAETLLHPRGLGDFRVLVVRFDREPRSGTSRPNS